MDKVTLILATISIASAFVSATSVFIGSRRGRRLAAKLGKAHGEALGKVYGYDCTALESSCADWLDAEYGYGISKRSKAACDAQQHY